MRKSNRATELSTEIFVIFMFLIMILILSFLTDEEHKNIKDINSTESLVTDKNNTLNKK